MSDLEAEVIAKTGDDSTYVFDDLQKEVAKLHKKDKKAAQKSSDILNVFLYGFWDSDKDSLAKLGLDDASHALKLKQMDIISRSRNPFARTVPVAELASSLELSADEVTSSISHLVSAGAIKAEVREGEVLFSSDWRADDLRGFRDLMHRMLAFPLSKAAETAGSKAQGSISEVVREAETVGINFEDSSLSEEVRYCMYVVGTTFPQRAAKHRPFLLGYIRDGKTNRSRFDIYNKYFTEKVREDSIDASDFEKNCGIGVEVSDEQVVEEAKKLAAESAGWGDYGAVMKKLNDSMKFADAKVRKTALDTAMVAAFGEKTAAKVKASKPQKTASKKKNEPKEEKKDDVEGMSSFVKNLPKTEDNTVNNSPKLLAAHLKRTGGKVFTRFPPEPNGYLHIGHAKSMHLNFGYAKRMGGHCYLRFDDTNPSKEKQEYIDNIISAVEWLGHTPYKITYASDYFPELYDFAVFLIKKGKAYVCHQSREEMQEFRRLKKNSPWRDRPIEENLKLFEDMRKGLFEEGAAMLRVKGDMQHVNPNMRDFVAYRIIYKVHPHAGDKWCIYPSYDYTHCICDSIEDITHSMCSLEFENRKISYIWLLQELEIYCPPQIEFSRLNLTYCVMSKRKLKRLVELGIVDGWDDPRMPTILGARRRGITPDALNLLCEKVGVSRNANIIDYMLLEDCLRTVMEDTVPKTMVVLDPIRVVVSSDEPIKKTIEVKAHTSVDMGSYNIDVSNVLYIEREDFSEETSKDFYRLTPKQAVGLKYLDAILECTSVEKDKAGNITEIRGVLHDRDAYKGKVKSYIHWVSEAIPGKKPPTVEVRLYEHLFTEPFMDEVPDYLTALNPKSLTIVQAYVHSSLLDIKHERVQFERNGFFYKDPKVSTPNHPVWNKIVGLRTHK